MLGDVIDGLESYQAMHADALIESQLGDLRYIHHFSSSPSLSRTLGKPPPCATQTKKE
jgi:hypothetical protein